MLVSGIDNYEHCDVNNSIVIESLYTLSTYCVHYAYLSVILECTQIVTHIATGIQFLF